MANRLCDRDCNNCEAVENKQVALLLNVLALRFGDEVCQIANQICPNLTGCPICRIDDFCHDDDDDGAFVTPISRIEKKHRTCEVAKQAVEFFNRQKKECNNGKETRINS